MKKTKILQKCIIGILFVVAGVIYLGTSISGAVKSNEKTEQMAVSHSDEVQEDEANLLMSQTTDDIQPKEAESVSVLITPALTKEKKIVVHVCGCVTQPDVYELQENARVIDAVNAAKGFTKDAACDRINQAQYLSDGQRIYIPSKDEMEEGLNLEESAVTADSVLSDDHQINLNLATKEELMTLPGIGEAKAERILAYREEHGGFQTIEDIKQIAGVKEAVFSKVKDLITVR